MESIVKYLKYALVAVAVYLVLLLALMPANFVVGKVAMPQGVTLGSAQGTLWQGKLDLIDYRGTAIKNISWSFSWLSLLQGRLAVDSAIGRGRDEIRGGGLIGYSLSGIFASDFTLRAPVEVLTQLQPLPLGLNATGALKLTLNDYLQGDPQQQPWCQKLSAKLQLNAATISSNFGVVDVEKAEATIDCEKGDVVAVMEPKTNSLGIDAKGVLASNRQLVLTGFVKPPANAPRDFIELLKFSGRPDNNGRYRLNFSQAI